ncbi:MAG: hypothetical protein L0154_12925 [Chloroflexi bacterium]|nr:hypothetical protein [Chloroflexota bacterium]
MKSKWILCLSVVLAALTVVPLFSVNAGIGERQPADIERFFYATNHAIVQIDIGSETVESTEIAAFEDTLHCTEWSDDGRWLMLGRETGIYRMDAESYAIETLVSQEDIGEDESFIIWCPLLSPDKRRIAFRTHDPDYSAALYSVNINGENLARLVENMSLSADWIGPVDWSYDSQWMIFSAGIEGEFGKWRIHPDGTQLEMIQRAGDLKSLELELLASLSPDQQRIAYFAFDPDRMVAKDLNGASDDILFEIAGSESFGPVWTADSQNILLISFDFFEMLYVQRFDLTSQSSELLSTNTQLEFEALTGILPPSNPIWSPDREWAVITQTGQILDIDTGELIDLPGASGLQPVLWDADSEQVLYLAGTGEAFGIYRYDIQTQSAALVVSIDPETPIWNLEWWGANESPQQYSSGEGNKIGRFH